MPDEPFRLRVMLALTEQIKGITTDGGYQFDLSDYRDDHDRLRERVFRGRDIFGATDPLPLVTILEDPGAMPSDNGSDGRGAINKFRVLIQGFLRDDETGHPLDDAYRLGAAIVQRLAEAKRPSANGILGMGRRVMAMNIGQPVHRPGGDHISDTAYLILSVTFTLVEMIDKPYD